MGNNTIFLHIDFNSYFATVEQQANPRLRGKPIGVTGGDRMERTVIGAASVEAKKRGVKTGMHFFEAKKICPDLILVRGDSEKYLECTKRFLNILKRYSPDLEVFSIDEAFLGLENSSYQKATEIAIRIKDRIKKEVGEWITCSVGISYNKTLAKLAGSMYKPDGLVVIADSYSAQWILDRVELDDICGIGFRIKQRLYNMGVFNFTDLRKVSLPSLLASFKSYGLVLYNMARGTHQTELTTFYEKEEVKSVGHQHTTSYDTNDPEKIKQILLKMTELVARRLRAKKLIGKTVNLYYRSAFNPTYFETTGHKFFGNGMQTTILSTNDGLEIFTAAWKTFLQLWDREAIRMIAVSVANLKPVSQETGSLLDDYKRREVITRSIDTVNNRYGEFTLQRGILLGSDNVKRKPNPFLSDRRFKL